MGFLTGTTINSIDDIQSICLDMEHSFMGDLVIYVTCPNGQQIMLHQQGGGGTQIGVPNQLDNIDCGDPTTQGVPWQYCFTPTATETWVEWVAAGNGTTLVEGDYEPIQPFTNLVGCPTNGIWTLTVVDNWAADDGQLYGFSLTLDPSLYPDITEFTPLILPGPSTSYWTAGPFSTVTDSNLDNISIVPTAAGEFTYTYTVVDDFGCLNDTSFTATVFDALNVTAPADFGVGCDIEFLQGWYEGYPAPQCSECVLNATYCYIDNDSFTWTYCTDDPSDGIGIAFSMISGQMENGFETLTIHNGPTTASPIIATWSQGDASGQTWNAPSGCITIVFDSDGSISCNSGSFANNWIYSVQPSSPSSVLEWSPDGYVWEWSPIAPLNNASLQAPNIVDLTSTTTFTVTGYPVGHPLCASNDQVTVSLQQNQDAGNDNSISICSIQSPFDMRDSLLGTPWTLGAWMDMAGNPLADGIFDPSVDLPGSYRYYIPLGCDTAQLNIAIVPQLLITAPNDTIICNGGQLDMSVYSTTDGRLPYSYNWSYDGTSVSNSEDFTYLPIQSGLACIHAQDACNYVSDHCFDVVVLPAIEVTFTSDTLDSCWPHIFEFNNITDSSTFTSSNWSMGDATTYLNTNLQTYNYANPGVYTVTLTLTNASGCFSASDQTVTAWYPPIAGYIANPQPADILDTEIHFNNQSSGDIQVWLWTFGNTLGTSSSANPTFNFPNTHGDIYPVTLQVTDLHNCTDYITGEIVINDILSIYVPNAFTPNGDGINDVLFVEGADMDLDQFHFMVFDRYGDKVFESKDFTKPWVGDVHGGEFFAPNGVYNWRMLVRSKTTGDRKDLTGSISLIR